MKKYLLVVIGLLLAVPVSAAEFETNLRYGARSPEVTKLQEFLQDEGLYTGPLSGNFYSLTLKAVKTFQTREAISPASGYFGPLTRTRANAIIDSQLVESNNEVGSEPIVFSKTTDDVVNSLQQQYQAMEENNRLLVEQLARQQTIINRVQEQNTILDTIRQNTTPVVESSPIARIEAPYRWEQINLWPNIRGGYRNFYVHRPNSNWQVFINDVEVNFEGNSGYIINLSSGRSYPYRFVFHEEGREDSIFEGTTPPLFDTAAVNCKSEKPDYSREFATPVELQYICEAVEGIEPVSVNLEIDNRQENQDVTFNRVVTYNENNKTNDFNNFTVTKNTKYSLPLTVSGQTFTVSATIVRNSISRTYYMLSNLRLRDTQDGREFTIFPTY